MLRHVHFGSVLFGSALLGGAVALVAGVGPARAGGEPGLYRRGPHLPPEIAYRDPSYIPTPPLRPLRLEPVVLAPRPLGLPLYNEPPPRFPTP